MNIERTLKHLFAFMLTMVALGIADHTQGEPAPKTVWTELSSAGLYIVSIEPVSGTVPVGELHQWIVTVRTADNSPVYPARIAVGGGMRGHGHGLPTQPQVIAYGGKGDYLVDGIRFNMNGEWRLSFQIESAAGSDRVDFDISTSLQPEMSSENQIADSQWFSANLAILKSLSLNFSHPISDSPSNQVANSTDAAMLGQLIFFDRRASGNGELACASCHQPEKLYTDGLARSVGIAAVMRNAPTVVGSTHGRWFYWDGRRDSLWAQALIPFEAIAEMGSDRLAVVRLVATDEKYRALYESVFDFDWGELDFDELPEHAGPFGKDAARNAWHSLSAGDQKLINSTYSNIGKSIAAFERTLHFAATRYDRFVVCLANIECSNATAIEILGAEELHGLRLFLDSGRTQCLQCHNGALFTNGDFHNIGTGNFGAGHLDFGRSIGLQAVLMDEFNCLGPYSDAESTECVELRFLNKDSHVPLRGAFKVPSLRGLSQTAPYFHDGRFDSLLAVIDYYNAPPLIEDVGPHELNATNLTDSEKMALEAFLLTLSE